MRRVAVTGVGIISCLGNNQRDVLAALQAGRSGIGISAERKALGFRSSLAGQIVGLELPDAPKRNLRQMGPGTYFGVHAVRQAIEDAGWDTARIQSDRTAVIIGNAGNSQDTYRQCHAFHDEKLKLGGTALQKVMADTTSANLSVLLGTRGYTLTVSAACATGAAAIGLALQLIRGGLQDQAIAGGVQEDTWEAFCHFDALRAFSVRENEPTKASRPFDRHRDGLVPSAGSGVLILEELEQARQRGARIYAELIGYAFSSDGGDMTIPTGEGSVRALHLALQDAGLRPDEVDYINAHATSTMVGDASEARAIAEVFGSKPYVSSTKSMTGHELATCGSSEVIYTLLMMQNQFIAPNINLDELDPQCEGINLVANRAVEARLDVAASNAFGFGGVNTCLVLRKRAA